MDKKSKIVVILLLVFIVIILAFLGYTYTSKLNNGQVQDTNQVYAMNETIQQNEVENNVVENEVENVVENVISNNTVTENKENVTKNQVKKEEPTKPAASNNNSEIQADNDEDKAIEIVKKDWGDTSGVAFKVEQINADGTYVISVRDEDSIALDWYTVNPKTGEFTK